MEVSVDTNVLLKKNFSFEDYEKVNISIVSIEELDGLKNDREIGALARSAINKIRKARNKNIVLITKIDNVICLREHKNDNEILTMAYKMHLENKETVFLTNDYNLLIKAEALGIPCQLFEKEEIYKGYRSLSGDTNFINDLYQSIENGDNKYNFLINEYLILHNTDTNKTSELRFDGKKFVNLKLPSSKYIKGKNSQQRFALDLLMNRNIPIKIIAGGFGSGKTFLSVKVGLDLVLEKEFYKNLVFLRNPVVADGADIGFLPGDKQEKIQDFCRPFLQYLEDPKGLNQEYGKDLIGERIKMDVVSFLKGVSIDDSFVIMDEAEDLNIKLVKLIGSRLGENSCIVFTGDWNQSEDKYKKDNGLLELINKAKNNELVGIVVLDEDVRSPASKVFSTL